MASSPAPEIKVKITGEDTGVSAAIKELSLQLQQLKKTQDDASGSARKLGEAEAGAGRSMREAREGARLLSEETGVHLSRGLATIVSKSSLLGPLLNAAFPIAAAIGFGEVLISAAEKFSELIANTFIFTDAMKAAYKNQVAVNQEMVKFAEDNKKLDEESTLIGLKGTEREIAEIRHKGEEIAKVQQTITDLENKRGAARLGLPSISTGETVQFTDTDQASLGQAQGHKKNLETQQRNLEQQAMVDKAAEDKTEAEKAKTLLDQTNKAKLAQLEAGFANELALYKAQHARLDQDNDAAFVKGLESSAAFYERKRALAAEESKKEIDALTAERSRVLSAPTKDKSEQIANQTKAADLANKISIARVNASKIEQQLTNEQAQKQDELDHKKLEVEAQIAKAQGQRFDEAAEQIAAQAIEMGQKLREQGMAPDQIEAMVSKFKSAATQQAQFAGRKSGGQDAIADLSSQEEDIRLKNNAIVADVKVAELERTRIPVLQAIAAQLKAMAIGPDQVKEADDFARSVDKIAVASKNSTVSMQNFGNQASTAIKGDLTTFLGSTITQVHSVGDAFRQLAGSVVGSIEKIVAQLLIQLAIQKLVKAAATAGFFAGGLVSSGGSGGGGHAEGGLVLGPGTGTSDSIPARLSTGEFVMRAAAVQDIGVDRLTMMNRGVHIPPIRGMSIPRFAEGGLVQAGGGRGGAMDLKLGLGLDPGLVLHHLESKAAGKVILQHIASNPKAAGKALSRGGH